MRDRLGLGGVGGILRGEGSFFVGGGGGVMEGGAPRLCCMAHLHHE